jgi:hypothetical protein
MKRAWGKETGVAATALRSAAGFLIGLVFWIGFSRPYESIVAAAAEAALRATEWPAVTRLDPANAEFLVERSDFPPAAPRPGLPAGDLHFNFVLLAALFALDPHPWRPRRVGAFLIGCALLAVVHVAALFFQVRALYAAHLGAWSAAHYGAFARNFWAGGFHFYQIAGRFAAPFAIWWPLKERSESEARNRTGKATDSKRRAGTERPRAGGYFRVRSRRR